MTQRKEFIGAVRKADGSGVVFLYSDGTDDMPTVAKAMVELGWQPEAVAALTRNTMALAKKRAVQKALTTGHDGRKDVTTGKFTPMSAPLQVRGENGVVWTVNDTREGVRWALGPDNAPDANVDNTVPDPIGDGIEGHES